MSDGPDREGVVVVLVLVLVQINVVRHGSIQELILRLTSKKLVFSRYLVLKGNYGSMKNEIIFLSSIHKSKGIISMKSRVDVKSTYQVLEHGLSLGPELPDGSEDVAPFLPLDLLDQH